MVVQTLLMAGLVAASCLLALKANATLTRFTSNPVASGNGGKGLVYSMESSTDLANWTSAATLTDQTGNVIWINLLPVDADNAFFRAHEA